MLLKEGLLLSFLGSSGVHTLAVRIIFLFFSGLFFISQEKGEECPARGGGHNPGRWGGDPEG